MSGLPLRILEILLASGGRVVTRAEFKQALWPHALRIDTERRLNTAMRALREALGDSGVEPRFIETLRGRGYRWIADEPRARPGRPARRARWLMPVAAALLLAIAGSSTSVAGSPDAEQQARLVRLAAAEDRGTALAGVEALLRERPAFAEAHLLRAQLAVDEWRAAPAADRLNAATDAVEDAARVLGGRPTVHTLAAELVLAGHWNWAGAEAHYRAALRQDPSNAAALRGLAWLYVNSGRRDEAWNQVVRLTSLASLTTEARADLGWLLLRMERPDLAADVCRAGEDHVNLLACRHTALARVGAAGAARDAALELMEAVAADPRTIARVREAPPALGYGRFLQWRAVAFLPRGSSPFQQAQVLAEAGRYQAALAFLDRALAQRDPLLIKVGSTHEFEPLSRSPRFRALLSEVLRGA